MLFFHCRPFRKPTAKNDCKLRWAHQFSSLSAWNSSTPTDWLWVNRVTGLLGEQLLCYWVNSYWVNRVTGILGTSAEVPQHITNFCPTEQGMYRMIHKTVKHFMEPEGSLPHSQATATCTCPGPAQSSPHTHIPPHGDQS